MVQWFFGFSGNATDWFREMIQVAVVSARENTSFEPHCIYDGEETELIEWLERSGVVVHRDQVPFREELFAPETIDRNAGSPYKPVHATGHFLRLLVAKHASGEVALYTDCDVMFRREPSISCPTRIAAVAELDAAGRPTTGSFNSGVIVMNLGNLRAVSEDLVAFVRENGFYDSAHCSYDQVLLNKYYAHKWAALPPEMNWRPTQGANPQASIVHFHGPKPQRVAAILAGEALVEEDGLLPIIERDRAAYDAYIGEFRHYLAAAGPTNPRRFGSWMGWNPASRLRSSAARLAARKQSRY